MNHSGDAAEQIVRLSLEGVEVAAKITGTAVKEIAIALAAALKNRDKGKVKGQQGLTAMIKSGKPLDIFSIKNSDLPQFVKDAKRYGIVYCVLRKQCGDKNSPCEIMVRVEDSPKINRIVENIKIATVDTEVIKREIEQDEKGIDSNALDSPEKGADDTLLDELLGEAPQEPPKTLVKPSAEKQEQEFSDSFSISTEKTPPFENISGEQEKAGMGTLRTDEERDGSQRSSVREELKEIKATQKEKADAPKKEELAMDGKPKAKKALVHKQPARKKTIKPKER